MKTPSIVSPPEWREAWAGRPPECCPQTAPYRWWTHHDAYGAET